MTDATGIVETERILAARQVGQKLLSRIAMTYSARVIGTAVTSRSPGRTATLSSHPQVNIEMPWQTLVIRVFNNGGDYDEGNSGSLAEISLTHSRIGE
jgi:hypothetical protein